MKNSNTNVKVSDDKRTSDKPARVLSVAAILLSLGAATTVGAVGVANKISCEEIIETASEKSRVSIQGDMDKFLEDYKKDLISQFGADTNLSITDEQKKELIKEITNLITPEITKQISLNNEKLILEIENKIDEIVKNYYGDGKISPEEESRITKSITTIVESEVYQYLAENYVSYKDLTTLKQHIDQNTTDIKALKESMTYDFNRVDQDISNLQVTLDQITQQLEKTKADGITIDMVREEVKRAVSALETKFDKNQAEMQKQINRLDAETQSLMAEGAAERAAREQAIINVLNKMEEMNALYNADLEEVKKAYKASDIATKAELQREWNDSLEKSMKELTDLITANEEANHKAHEELVNKVAEEHDFASENIDEINRRLDELSGTKSGLSELDRRTKELETKYTEVSKTVIENNEKTLEKISTLTENMASEDNKLQKAIDTLKKDTEASFTVVNADIDSLRAGLKAEESARITSDEKLQAEIDTITSRTLVNLEKKLQGEIDENKRLTDEDKKALQEAISELKTHTKESFDKTNETLTALAEQDTILAAEIENIKNEISTAKTALENRITLLDEEIAAEEVQREKMDKNLQDQINKIKDETINNLKEELIEEIEKKNGLTEADIAEIRTQLSNYEKDTNGAIAIINDRLNSVEEKNAEQDQKISDLMQKLTEEVEARKTGDKELQNQIDTLTKVTITNLKSELQQEIQNASDANQNALSTAIAELDKKTSMSIASAKAELDLSIATNAGDIKDLQTLVDSLKTKMDEADNELNNKIVVLQSDLEAERAARIAGDEDLAKKIAALKNSIDSISQSITNDFSTRIAALELTDKSQKAEYQQLFKDAKAYTDTSTLNLKTEINKVIADNTKTQDEKINEVKTLVETYNKSISDRLTDLEKAGANVSETLTAHNTKITAIESSLSDLSDALTKEANERKAEDEAIRQALSSSIDEVNTQIDALSAQVDNSMTTLTKAISDSEDKQKAEYTKLVNDTRAANQTAINKAKSDLTAIINNNTKTLQEKDTELNNLIKGLQGDLTALTDDLTNKINTNDENIKKSLKDATAKINGSITNINTAMTNLSKNISTMNGNITTINQDITQLKSQIGNYKLWVGTQAQYNAIATKDANTLYFIKD